MHMYPDLKNKNEDTIVHDYVHDIFKETFRDPNWDYLVIKFEIFGIQSLTWFFTFTCSLFNRANTESLSSREHWETYERPKGRKPDITIYRIMKKGVSEECKVECEEQCFVEVKHFSITRNSKIGGYNLFKVAILCQGTLIE